MKLIAIETELTEVKPADYKEHLRAEATALWDLVQSGLVRETYFRADDHTAVLVLESPSPAAARQGLDALPLVRDGLVCFDIIPLAPYDGFARLFAEGE